MQLRIDLRDVELYYVICHVLLLGNVLIDKAMYYQSILSPMLTPVYTI